MEGGLFLIAKERDFHFGLSRRMLCSFDQEVILDLLAFKPDSQIERFHRFPPSEGFRFAILFGTAFVFLVHVRSRFDQGHDDFQSVFIDGFENRGGINYVPNIWVGLACQQNIHCLDGAGRSQKQGPEMMFFRDYFRIRSRIEKRLEGGYVVRDGGPDQGRSTVGRAFVDIDSFFQQARDDPGCLFFIFIARCPVKRRPTVAVPCLKVDSVCQQAFDKLSVAMKAGMEQEAPSFRRRLRSRKDEVLQE